MRVVSAHAAAELRPCLLRAFLLILMVACSRPGSYEEFVRAEDAVNGVYEFVIPAEKEESAFDLSLYTAPLEEPLQLEISIDSLKERVWFPAGEHKALYRSGMRDLEAGTKLQIRPLDTPEGFRGIGIIIKRNDGAR